MERIISGHVAIVVGMGDYDKETALGKWWMSDAAQDALRPLLFSLGSGGMSADVYCYPAGSDWDEGTDGIDSAGAWREWGALIDALPVSYRDEFNDAMRGFHSAVKNCAGFESVVRPYPNVMGTGKYPPRMIIRMGEGRCVFVADLRCEDILPGGRYNTSCLELSPWGVPDLWEELEKVLCEAPWYPWGAAEFSGRSER